MPQVIKKKKIVLASVLKPVDDPRMFDKLAGSFCDLDACEVIVMGYPGNVSQNNSLVEFIPSRPFSRISVDRLLQPWRMLFHIIRLKPTHLIIGTHELLLIGTLSKMLTGLKLLYDTQENYYLNILHLSAFPKYIRYPIAFYVRLKEIVSSPFVDLYILSDGCYQHQLKFVKSKFIIAENKILRNNISGNRRTLVDKSAITLLFSGTLSESTGVFTAIKLAKELHKIDTNIQLSIIGYCAQGEILRNIKETISNADFIQLIGGDQHVRHATIINHIQSADVGIIAYPPNPATHNKFPTKLFEYIGTHLPIILTPNSLLEPFCSRYDAALKVNPDRLNAQALLSEMKNKTFYSHSPGDEILWESEVTEVIKALNTI